MQESKKQKENDKGLVPPSVPSMEGNSGRMIEVEARLILTPYQKQQLLSGAQFVEQKKYHDEYFDTENYDLFFNKWTFRKRDDRPELKHKFKKKDGVRYNEEIPEEEILAVLSRQILGKPFSGDLESFIKQHLHPFARFGNTRTRYRKHGIFIDFDETDFGYEVCEFEEMTTSKKEAKEGEKKIREAAKKEGFIISKGLDGFGKMHRYLLEHDPALCYRLYEQGSKPEK